MRERSAGSRVGPRGGGELVTAVEEQQSKSELAYWAVRNRILDGTYPADQRLVLSRLADELEISALPIREALRRLEAEGLVEFTRHVGAVVTRIDLKDYVETLAVLSLLESAATAASALRLTPEQLQVARATNTAMREALDTRDMRSYTELNRAFHEQLCVACPNQYLLTSLAREWNRLDMIRRSAHGMIPERARKSVDEHDQLLALIEAGASHRELERASRLHKQRTLEAFQASNDSSVDPQITASWSEISRARRGALGQP